MENQEKLELSKDYKRGFNHAELVISQFPKMLESMQPSKDEQSEYSIGFQDRVAQHEMEKDLIKGESYKQLSNKYAHLLDKSDKALGKDDREH